MTAERTPSSGAADTEGLDLTPEALTDALRTGGHAISISGFTAEPVGTGQMGNSFRLHLAFDGDPGEVPSTLVAKVAAGPAEKRAVAAGTYRTEVDFYRRLAPTVAIRVPRCWHSWIAEDSTDFLLLLDDLAPAVQGDQLAGCTPAQALAAAENLAGLHGPRWCDASLVGDGGFERVDAEGAAMLGSVLEPMTELFVSRFDDRLSREDREVLRRIPAVAGAWLSGRPERFAPVHGDYRLDNLMFGPDGTVTALDWQTLSLGLPARDLAYLCATGLDPEDRAASEADIVAAYHRALVAQGVVHHDLDECLDDYRYGLLQAPLIIVLGCAVGTPTERGDEMFLAMTRRSCAAIRELDPFALIDA